MTTFIIHCNSCGKNFEHAPYHKNYIAEDGRGSKPKCPKCGKTDTTLVKKIPINEDETKKSRFEKYKEGTKDLEQRRISY